MKKHSLVLILTIFTLLGHSFASAQEIAEETKASAEAPTKENILFKSLEYPELQVVPKASERVFLEAKAESDYGLLVHWPIQVSGVMTLVAGLTSSSSYADNDPNPSEHRVQQSKRAAMTATGIGAGWILGTYLLSAAKPYQSSLAGVKKIKATDRRNELLRERMAEEALENQARLINTLHTLSVTTNLLANVWVASESSGEIQAFAAVSATFALIPWIFPHRQIEAYNKHLEYKRKIYSPISSLGFGLDPESAKLAPQWTLSWSF